MTTETFKYMSTYGISMNDKKGREVVSLFSGFTSSYISYRLNIKEDRVK